MSCERSASMRRPSGSPEQGTEMYCAKCGQENHDEALYCMHCGAKIGRSRGKSKTPWLIAGFGLATLVIIFIFTISHSLKTIPLGRMIGQGGIRVTLQVDPRPDDDWPAGAAGRAAKMESIREILLKRAKSLGVWRAKVVVQNANAYSPRVVVELPGVKGSEADIAESICSTARIEVRHLRDVHYANGRQYRPTAARYALDISTDEKGDHYAFTDANGRIVPESQVLAESPLILSWSDLKPVSMAQKDPVSHKTAVALEFTPHGKQTFADFTRRNVGEILAIVLDGRILSSPSITEPILDGRAVIRGSFSVKDAQVLAGFLNASALPVHLRVVSKESL